MLINPVAGVTPPEVKPLKADEGTARIPLSLFPLGVKPGDRVSITITGVDSLAGTATIVADEPTNAVAPAPENPDAISKEVTMGPIDDLKSYLFKKEQEKVA